MRLIVPCNICIKRFYRAYAEVDENATDEEIRRAMIKAIIKYQDEELAKCHDISIKERDIVAIEINHDGEWTECEYEEIKQIFSEFISKGE